jgi:hypothetical protein
VSGRDERRNRQQLTDRAVDLQRWQQPEMDSELTN